MITRFQADIYRCQLVFSSRQIHSNHGIQVPEAGFEPVHGYPYSDLNAARLPVPPLGQATILFYTILISLKRHFLELPLKII